MLCRPGGADPPADVGAMNLGHQKVADWRMLTVTLKLKCYYNINFFFFTAGSVHVLVCIAANNTV